MRQCCYKNLWPLKHAAEMTSRLRKKKKSQCKQDQSHAQQGLLGSARKCKEAVQRKYHHLDRHVVYLSFECLRSTSRVGGEFEAQAKRSQLKGELE